MSFPIRTTEVCWFCKSPMHMKIVDDGKHFCGMKCHYAYVQEREDERRLEEEREAMVAFAEAD